MPPKQERDAEEDDETWRYRNLERKLVMKETIYGPSHIAIVPTLLDLAVTNFTKCETEEAITRLERALIIKDSHPGLSSDPETRRILLYLGLCFLRTGMGDVTKITHVVDRSLTLQETKAFNNSTFHAKIMAYLCLESHVERRVEFQERLLKILEEAISSKTALPYDTDCTILNLRTIVGLTVTV